MNTSINSTTLSYWNQSIDFQSESMDSFLYERDHCHERVKGVFSIMLNNCFFCDGVFCDNSQIY